MSRPDQPGSPPPPTPTAEAGQGTAPAADPPATPEAARGEPALAVSALATASTPEAARDGSGRAASTEAPEVVRAVPLREAAGRPMHPSGWTPVRRSPFGQRVLLFCVALGVSGFFGFSALRQLRPSSPEGDVALFETSVALAAQAPPAAPGTAPQAVAPPPDGGVDGPPLDIVKITFQTVPPVKAEVLWGKKRLGFINGVRRPPIKPLIVERPRDSGPIDIVVKAEGFLPVNTRAYTFNDNKLNVKLTPVTEKHTLLGFKQALPDAGADGGVDDGGNPIPPPPPPPVQGPLPPPATYGPAPQPPAPPPAQ